jgi:activating signal cointegrator complex subunit 3
MLGLSTAMANGSDIANWFGVEKHCFFNFKYIILIIFRP